VSEGLAPDEVRVLTASSLPGWGRVHGS
jgi:hypothetical protein